MYSPLHVVHTLEIFMCLNLPYHIDVRILNTGMQGMHSGNNYDCKFLARPGIIITRSGATLSNLPPELGTVVEWEISWHRRRVRVDEKRFGVGDRTGELRVLTEVALVLKFSNIFSVIHYVFDLIFPKELTSVLQYLYCLPCSKS